MAEPITSWLDDLRAALSSEQRLRAGRVLTEAEDHLYASADAFERAGILRSEAEQMAVDKLGDPRLFAGGFSRPTSEDRIIDTTARWSSRIAALLLAFGAVLILIEALAWIAGAGSVSAQGARIWRTCRQSIDGECVGGWDETRAPALAVLGAICLAAGLIALALHLIMRHRYSDLELAPPMLDLAAELSLTALGLALLMGGVVRSALDGSWRWVPVWLSLGLVCLGAACLLRRLANRVPLIHSFGKPT